MSSERSLPQRRNPLLESDRTPQHEILVERRCHAQTNLSVRPGLVGTSNATKAENLLDKFDYVHLRVPLPKDLTGSEIFSAAGSAPVPESYFLMRRSNDGFISATGMFKASFPWASKAEEHDERKYIKDLPKTDPQEVAGNLWVPPEFALDLATEYQIVPWILALLDNEDVEYYSTAAHGPQKITQGRKPITSPPHFEMPPKAPGAGRKQRAASREVRSASPTKMAPPTTPGRPKKTPRKPRAKKVVTAAPTSSVEATPSVADSAADSGDDVGREAEVDELSAEPAAESAEIGREENQGDDNQAEDNQDEEDDDDSLGENNVRVSVQEEIKDDGHSTTTHTTVKVQLPASSPDLKLPTDTEGVVEMAKEIIESVKGMEASKVEAATADLKAARNKKSLKRSRDEYEDDTAEGAGDGADGGAEDPSAENKDAVERRPAKRTRLMVPAEEYRKEKVKKRALMGLSGALAFGLIIPAISTFWA